MYTRALTRTTVYTAALLALASPRLASPRLTRIATPRLSSPNAARLASPLWTVGERELWYDTEEKDSEHDRLSSRQLHHVVIHTDNLTK